MGNRFITVLSLAIANTSGEFTMIFCIAFDIAKENICQ